jgi:hypothetical protein
MSMCVDPFGASGASLWPRGTLASPILQIRARGRHRLHAHVRLGILILWLALLGSGITRSFGESLVLRKPPPEDEHRPDAALLAEAIRERYPTLLTDTGQGTPFVMLVFDPYGHVETSALERFMSPVRHVVATAQTFDRFGLPPGTLRYIGFEQVKLGAQSVPVAFGVTDARELDRALVEERFPGVLERHSTVDGDLWILFDHSGQVLRSGIERADARKLCVTLERRYPEIRTVSVRVTRVYARDGHPIERSRRAPLHLYSVWLAARSPLPSEPETLQVGQ